MTASRLTVTSLLLSIVGCLPPMPDPAPPATGTPDPGTGSGGNIGSGAPIDAGTPTLTATTYLQQLATKQCEEAFACQASYSSTDLLPFSQTYGATTQECTALVTARFAPSTVEAEISAGKVTFAPATAASCLATLAFGDCTGFWATGGATLARCAQVFHGSVSEGEPCVIDLDCVDQDSVCPQGINICLPSGIDPGD